MCENGNWYLWQNPCRLHACAQYEISMSPIPKMQYAYTIVCPFTLLAINKSTNTAPKTVSNLVKNILIAEN